MKPDTSRVAVQTLASHWHGEYICDLLNALVDERDALLVDIEFAIFSRDEAIRMMGEASRQAGSWQGISEGKNIVVRQLEAERDAAVHMERNLAHALGETRAEVATLRANLRAAFLDRLAANDAPLLNLEAAFAAGAEAMRRAAMAACVLAAPPAHTYASENAEMYRAQDTLRDRCVAAIRDLPTPKMDTSND